MDLRVTELHTGWSWRHGWDELNFTAIKLRRGFAVKAQTQGHFHPYKKHKYKVDYNWDLQFLYCFYWLAVH